MLPQQCLLGTHLHLPRATYCDHLGLSGSTLGLHVGRIENAGGLMPGRAFSMVEKHPSFSSLGEEKFLHHLPEFPSKSSEHQSPTEVTGLITYLLLASFSSLSHLPTHLLVFLGINSQNYEHLNPCVSVCFWGNPN